MVKLMSDTCQVISDPGGLDTSDINPDTLELIPPEESDDRVLYKGPCMIRSSGRQPNTAEQVGLDSARTEYIFNLPHTAPELSPGLTVRVPHSVDPSLKGDTFRILSIKRSSFHISREFTAVKMETSRG